MSAHKYFSMMGLFLLLGFATCKSESLHQKKGEITSPRTVEFCDLIAKPRQYGDTIIRTEAIFYANLENSVLYSPECGNAEQYVWADFEPSFQYADNSVKEKFNELDCQAPPCKSGKIKVAVIGRFEGPSQQGYGHLGAYRFRFVISRITKAEAAGIPH